MLGMRCVTIEPQLLNVVVAVAYAHQPIGAKDNCKMSANIGMLELRTHRAVAEIRVVREECVDVHECAHVGVCVGVQGEETRCGSKRKYQKHPAHHQPPTRQSAASFSG